MKVSIEKRAIAGNKQSLRLVYYYGSTTDANGKVVHQRKRETLDLFLYIKPKTPLEKQHNKEAEQLAEAIRAKRVVEAQSGKHGFNDSIKGKADFIVYLNVVVEEKRKSSRESTVKVLECSFNQFKKYAPQSIQFDQLTSDLVKGFADYFGLASEKPDSVKKVVISEKKPLGFTPMYESLALRLGLDFILVNPYSPQEADFEKLERLDILVMVPG